MDLRGAEGREKAGKPGSPFFSYPTRGRDVGAMSRLPGSNIIEYFQGVGLAVQFTQKSTSKEPKQIAET